MAAITFLGAAGTVTGSKYLVEGKQAKVLVDLGLFQGSREWNLKNWEPLGVDFSKINAALLTHAHIDHCGMFPRFAAQGLKAPVYATAATIALCGLLLPDSGRLQEEEAQWRAKEHRSRHNPPLPLYTEAQALDCLKQLRAVPFHKDVEIAPGISAYFSRMGHILGAGSINLSVDGKKITFSGDIGRYTVPILKDPEPVGLGDLLLIESTYGDRLHDIDPAPNALEHILKRTFARGGVVVIPSFAVGRTQSLLYHLRELKQAGRIPDVPVVVDSPMADDATRLYAKYSDDYDEAALGILKQGNLPFSFSKLFFTKDRSESIRLNSVDSPMVIIAASGMLTGGRILHHLRHRVSSPINTILFVGFQPPGSRGAWMKSGAKTMRLLGQEVPIRAEIAEISGLSAHGDRDELLRWCKSCSGRPSKVAIVHGEPEAAQSFAKTLHDKMGWDPFVASFKQRVEI